MASSIQHLAPLALCLLLLLTPNLVLAGKGGAANKGGGAKKGGGGGRGHKGGAGAHKVGGAAGGHKGGKGAAPKGGGGVGPAKPAGPGPAKPAGPGPAKPAGPGPAKPVGPGPAKPAGPGPAKPVGPGPAKPVGPGLAKPAGPGPVIPPGNPTGGDGGPGNGAGITYHGGPLLIGDINLSIIFYGQFMADQKNVVRGFLRSLENTENDHIAAVHRWWDIVESYQLFTGGNNGAGTPPRLRLKVGTQQSDDKYTLGKVLTIDFIKSLVQKANSGKPNTLHVIFTGSQVTVHNLCRGKCSEHGVIDDKLPYLIVGNPEIECPGACAWPFQRGDYGTPGQVTVKPPNGNIGIDAMLVNFASGLANAVTNPFNTGFFKPGPKGDPVEAGSACENIFGSGATPGQTGKTDVDPATGAAFNAVGEKGMKFMIPAVWNPRTSSCWTAM